MCARLSVDRDQAGACLGKIVDVPLWVGNHQMAVKKRIGMAAQRIDDERADGDVWHEVPVHHIDMKPVGAGGEDGIGLVGQMGKIA